MSVPAPPDEPRPPDSPEEPGASYPAASPPVASTAGVASSPGDPVAAAPAAADRRIPRTRVSAAYVALICSLLVLVLLLVFILENTRRVPVTFFGATGHLPLGVALLLAAVAGAAILGVAGTARILQLRRRVRRSRPR